MPATAEATGVRRLNNGHYLFDSASRPGVQHEVFPFETGTGWDYTCSCEGYRFTGKCWHVRSARQHEQERKSAAPVVAPARQSEQEMLRKMARFARN